MRKITLISFIFILLMASLSLAQEQRTITVTGDADINVVPDEVVITLGIETDNKDLTLAKNENDKIVKDLMKITEKFGILPKHIQTDYINIEPRYEDYYPQKKFIGYFVKKNVVITLKDISKFEDLLSNLLESGVNYVHGIQFQTTELRKYKDESRALAIKAAKEKAEALAGALGQKIGKPISIQENQTGWWSPYSSWWGGWGNTMAQNVVQNAPSPSSTESGSSFAPGMIKVNAQVTVTFELVD